MCGLVVDTSTQFFRLKNTMRQRTIWFIISGALSMLAIGCAGIGAAGYIMLRNVVPAATSKIAPDGTRQRFELPSTAASTGAWCLKTISPPIRMVGALTTMTTQALAMRMARIAW